MEGYSSRECLSDSSDLSKAWIIFSYRWFGNNELSIKDIPDVKVGEWRLPAGQEAIQEVEEPDAVDNIQKAVDEVQIEDENKFVLEGEQGAQLIVSDDETNDHDDSEIDVEED